MQGAEETRGFDDFTRNREIASHLAAVAQSGQASHAYLLAGEDAQEGRHLALLFARALQCTGAGEKPCNICPSCRKALGGNHPDIRILTHEKPMSIGVDEVREQIVSDVAVRPYEGVHKIYLIPEAELLTVQAQNALLKGIEEPPSYAVMILLAASEDSLLPTVVSRCTCLHLQAPEQAEIDPEVRSGAVHILRRSRELDVISMIESVKNMAAEKENIRAYLEAFRLWFRDVLLFKATREVDGLYYSEELPAIRERASVSGYEGLEAILSAIDTAEERLRANVNTELTLELLFLTIKEN